MRLKHERENTDSGVCGAVAFGLVEEGEVVRAEEHAKHDEEGFTGRPENLESEFSV